MAARPVRNAATKARFLFINGFRLPDSSDDDVSDYEGDSETSQDTNDNGDMQSDSSGSESEASELDENSSDIDVNDQDEQQYVLQLHIATVVMSSV